MDAGARSAGPSDRATAAAEYSGQSASGSPLSPFADDAPVQGIAPPGPPLRAGNSQCGVLPAAAEAGLKTVSATNISAGELAHQTMTPSSSTLSSSSAVHLRTAGCSDEGLASARFSPMQTPGQLTPSSSNDAAAVAAAAAATVTLPVAVPQAARRGARPPPSPFALQSEAPPGPVGPGEGLGFTDEERMSDAQRDERRKERVAAHKLSQVPSLSGAELSLCREITEEIKSESDLSSLLSGLCSTPGPSAHSSGTRSVATAPPALSKEVSDAVDRLRDMLPTSVISQLQTYDSYGLVDLLHSQGARQAALDAMEAGKTSAGSAPALGGPKLPASKASAKGSDASPLKAPRG